ncbi:hypothetical protein JGI10_00711 [Candidatus Kryptonium thompsonii]|nr:hypothetical protein JGI10_00711 [Candidatus Kryptonium thompsoni]
MWVAVSKSKIKTEKGEWNFDVNFVSSAGIDLKGEGEIEIVVGIEDDGRIVILNTKTGASKQVKIQNIQKIRTSPAVADLNLDGFPDMVITSGNKIWAFNYLGSVLLNFPIEVRNASELSSPVIVNFYGDSLPEIVVGTDNGQIYAFDVQGRIIPGFPVSISGSCVTSPAVYYESNLVYLFV